VIWLLLAAASELDFVPPTPLNQADWLTGVEYPDVAVFAEASGLTQADIFVDKIGRPKACYVVVSSGAPDLDGQTCAAAMHRGKFNAAKDEAGAPIAGIYRFGVTWILHSKRPGDYPADVTLYVPSLPGNQKSISMTLRYIVDVKGHIEKCATLVSSGFPGFDVAACRAMPARYVFAPARDKAGNAWRVVRTQTVAFDIASSTDRR
jgi:TonB family protein